MDQQRGAKITYSDPHVPSLKLDGLQMDSLPVQTADAADCVVIVTGLTGQSGCPRGVNLFGMWRVHRLDQINAQKPANLSDFKSLTLRILERTDWPVFGC